MSQELSILTVTAASLGLLHTIAGPDHYVPFIMISRARKWSLVKTAFITFLCGIGHILSAVLLGAVGLALGLALGKIKAFDAVRDSIGPCEVLIPLVMYPAAKNSLMDALIVTLIFGAVTIVTMISIITVSLLGFNLLPLGKFERYTHALAGLVIVVCGVLIII